MYSNADIKFMARYWRGVCNVIIALYCSILHLAVSFDTSPLAICRCLISELQTF